MLRFCFKQAKRKVRLELERLAIAHQRKLSSEGGKPMA
jgi:lipase chaperone LimK